MVKVKKIIMMIVEDDEVLLRALHLTFHDEGYIISTASDGDTGLKMVERVNPDIIILDLLLPKMNGFDFLKYVKSDSNTNNIPVVVLSNLGDEDSIIKAKGLGAVDYFIKSNTDLTILKDKVAKILKSQNKT